MKYEVVILGLITKEMAEDIDGSVIVSLESDKTILSCEIVDQAALMGVMRKMTSLGIRIISINEWR